MLNAVLWPCFNFVAKNRWAQIVLGVGVIWLVIMIYLWMRDSGVRKVERERLRVESMKEQMRVNNTRLEIEERRTNDIEQARNAGRTLPRFNSVDQLRTQRPDLYAELFGDSEGGSGEAESR